MPLLIHEHSALHRGYHNSQLSHQRKLNINSIVFANVQLQSKSSTNTVKKLSYIKRGPYKIINDFPSGLYLLQRLYGKNTTKKYGSESYLCPKDLILLEPVQTSDHAFDKFNHKIKNILLKKHVEGYKPSHPWTALAALVTVSQPESSYDLKLPSVSVLDNI